MVDAVEIEREITRSAPVSGVWCLCDFGWLAGVR